MSISIRTAIPADTETVADFNYRLALETEQKQLDRARLDPGVAAMLQDNNKGLYFLACKEDNIVGQLAITFEWSDWRNGWFWWFQSVYVVPEARGDGVFSMLFDHVLDKARARPDVCGLRLYVDKDNNSAQTVYLARGMKKTSYHVMELDFQHSD
ncbi:MAG: GNAT family N-acetyltransferase [Gammaproteobacteria bacterium]|nr:GNAT family N-acetyltransferase [Gammaproteobacteria bacterium]